MIKKCKREKKDHASMHAARDGRFLRRERVEMQNVWLQLSQEVCNVGKVRAEGRLGLGFEVGLRLDCVCAWSCSLTNDGCIAQKRKWEVKGLVLVVGVLPAS